MKTILDLIHKLNFQDPKLICKSQSQAREMAHGVKVT